MWLSGLPEDALSSPLLREQNGQYLASMLLIRRFEETVSRLFLRGEVYGSTHLCIGQEAVSVGVASALADNDWVAATYRGHGHSLALGVDVRGLMAEMLGRSTGVCGGRAGSMNIVDLKHRLIGCFGIVGGSIAAATGGALSQQLRKAEGVAVALFGDGAVNQAYFYECLNFAKVRRLPAVYVCENNQYGEYTATEKVTPGGILPRAAALQIQTRAVDGNDVWAVAEAMKWARAKALDDGPVFMEVQTYRFSGHGRGDPIQYRPEGELERWQQRDPIVLARQRMEAAGVAVALLDGLDRAVSDHLEAITAQALADPFPEPDSTVSEYAIGD